MKCKYPFMRKTNPSTGELYTKEQRLDSTPFPCGRCIPCRVNKRKIWTHRIELEAEQSDYSIFVTLTYDDENIPNPPNVSKSEVQNFLKRLRDYYKKPFRYYAVGEYGDKTKRPHYHLIIFNMHWMHKGCIEKAWKKGFVTIMEFTPNNAGYVTGYCMKKMTRIGDPRLEGKNPEFQLASKGNGGLGIKAIEEIAQQINNSYHWKHTSYKPPITHLMNGRKKRPLGTYLTNKLSDLIGADKKIQEENLWHWQQEIFTKYKEKETDHLCLNLVKAHEQQRKQQETRIKIYRKDRPL